MHLSVLLVARGKKPSSYWLQQKENLGLMSLEGSEKDSECSTAAPKGGHCPALSVGFTEGHLKVVVEMAQEAIGFWQHSWGGF